MAQEVEVHKHCPGCGGDGIYTGGVINDTSVPCTQCGGDGRQTIGYVHLDPGLDELATAIADVLDKCKDIKEKVDEIKTVVDAL